MKYKTIPIEIDAFRFGYDEYPDWFKNANTINLIRCINGDCIINTLEGKMRAKQGDWIIKGIKGELYPCKDDIFKQIIGDWVDKEKMMNKLNNSMFTIDNTYVVENNGHHTYEVHNVHDDQILSLVKFQKGPVKEFGLNGLFHEDLILMIIDRLEFFQTQGLKCQENEEALRHLYEAVMWLRKRTLDRQSRGVQGTSEV